MAFQFPEFPYFLQPTPQTYQQAVSWLFGSFFGHCFIKNGCVNAQSQRIMPFRKIKRNKHNILDSVAFRTDVWVSFLHLYQEMFMYLYIDTFLLATENSRKSLTMNNAV